MNNQHIKLNELSRWKQKYAYEKSCGVFLYWAKAFYDVIDFAIKNSFY